MADSDAYKHNFVPDDEGLFCLFCGRTEPEHKPPGPGASGGKDYFSTNRPDEFADDAFEGELTFLPRKNAGWIICTPEGCRPL